MLNYRMHKNILIIGYGDIGSRLKSYFDNSNTSLYILRRSAIDEKGLFSSQWDWLSGERFSFKDVSFDAVIIIPKPSNRDEGGYLNGFIKSVLNIERSLASIPFKKLIAISSTRVYGADQVGILNESINPIPSDYRGIIIREYEDLLSTIFEDKLTILRLSGLYSEKSKTLPFNKLHRDNAAAAIKFFIEDNSKSAHANTYNCSEDRILNPIERCIDNKKIKDIGFEFKQFS
jgi:hypothetical protein